MTVISGYLYVIGKFFYSGYLEQLGIDHNLFPLTFNEILFHGFLADLEVGEFIGVLLMPIVLVATIGKHIVSSVKIRVHKWLSSRSFARGDLVRKILELIVKPRFWEIIAIALFPAMYLLIVPIVIEKVVQNGIASADNELRKIRGMDSRTKTANSKKYVYIMVSQDEKSEQLIEGYRIAASDKFIAVYAIDAVQIIPIKDIKSITTKFNTTGKAQM